MNQNVLQSQKCTASLTFTREDKHESKCFTKSKILE